MAKILIIGGGFGGLASAKALAKKDKSLEITLVDKQNHHLFQPLLYQVAMAGLAPSDIAMPLRSMLSTYKNIKVLMNEVVNFNFDKKQVLLKDNQILDYDHLIISCGVVNNYHGHDQWAGLTYGIKDLGDAINLRNHLLKCFEQAEQSSDTKEKSKLLRFVVIGGGPTGVELAGSVAELCRFTLNNEFKHIEIKNAQVVLIERGQRILSTFHPELSQKARQQMEDLGVVINYGQGVKDISDQGVTLDDDTFLPTKTVIWAAGVGGGELLKQIPGDKDRSGRVKVNKDCSVQTLSNVYVIGDAAFFPDKQGQSLPGVSPVAMQQGEFVAENILLKEKGKKPHPEFKYFDKGSMATIGRKRAIADLHFIKLSGTWAWLAWLLVHLIFLIGFRNKFIVLFNWIWAYITYKRGARIINEPKIDKK